MNRRIPLICKLFKAALVTCALLTSASSAAAQTSARRAVSAGEVRGLELGLEGALSATRGDPLRWLLAVHEVVGLSDLRPAANARVRAVTSFAPATPTEITADAFGRATLELPVPLDAPARFGVVVEVFSAANRVQRRFELSVSTRDPRVLSLQLARGFVEPPGHETPGVVAAADARRGTIRALARLTHRTTARPLAGVPLRFSLRDDAGRPLGAPARVVTDASGLATHAFRAPRNARGTLTVAVHVEDASPADGAPRPAHVAPSAEASVSVETPASQPLLVAVAPDRVLATPGDTLDVDIVVRTADGQPVAGAVLAVDGLPRRRGEPAPTTDARGRARVRWPTRPELLGGSRATTAAGGLVDASYLDVPITVQANREGIGRGAGRATVRLTRARFTGALAAEGGSFPAAIGGRLFVRVVGLDGRAAPAGVPVVLRGPRLGPEAARGTLARDTDADGVARFELGALGPVAGEGGDPCGGETATSIRARIGDDASPTELSACVPLDPDAAARVRVAPQAISAGGHVRVDVARAPSAAGLPVLVSLLVREPDEAGGGLRAVASHVVPGDASTSELALPADSVGVVIVRARPLVGSERLEVRGGSCALWVTPGARAGTRLTLDGAARRAMLAFSGAPGERSAIVWALPVDEARALAASLEASMRGPLPELRRPAEDAGEALLEAALALATPPDLGAPAVLRGRERVAVPAPDAPERLGLLRDPWRARARFVGGRLALLFRALEQAVDAAVPERLADVAVRTPRGWDFNELVLESVRGEALGDAGATGLGGEPLDIAALRRLDPAFTYDRVAQRLTRERLWTMLLALRQLVQQSSLDLRWAVRGDPSEWLAQAAQIYLPGRGSVGPKSLVDAWGTPLALRPAPGGRARFTQLEPVVGYELVSAGPDTRFGSADDLWDPTAAVLPPGSLYAQAVGEEALVARLRGVELGRATVEMLAGSFGVGVGYVPPQAAATPAAVLGDAWGNLPPRLVADPFALALRRPALPGDGAGGNLRTLGDTGGEVPLELDAEPRTWGAVALTVTREGQASVALGEGPAGAPLLVAGALPERIRVGERLDATLTLTDARPAGSDGDVRYTVAVVTPDGVAVDTKREITVPFGQSATLPLALTASRAIQGTLRVWLTPAGTDTPARALEVPLVADAGRLPQRTRATVLARPGTPFDATLTVPADAVPGEARVVLLGPGALAGDPDLDEARHDDPALVAWSLALAGRPLDASLRARLLAVQEPNGVVAGASSTLSTATAALALASIAADDEAAEAARARAVGALGSGTQFDDADGQAAAIRTLAAAVAALATGGAVDPLDDEGAARDPVSSYLATQRAELRRALRTARGEPTLLARAAAALLVAEPEDGHGRAMLALAAASLASAPGGARVTPSAARADAVAESLSATLALGLAAHLAGDDALSRRLLGAATRDAALATRLGGEPLFWLLACGAYGALGTGDAPRATVTVDGRDATVTFANGRAVVALPTLTPGAHAVRVEAGGTTPLLARVETGFGAPFAARQGTALALSLSGDVGDAGGTAALELTVEAKRALRRSVVELQLPAGVRADTALLDALRAAPSVLRAEPRAPGFVRITLGPLAASMRIVLPLPLRFAGSGRLRGLGVSASPADAPGDTTVLAPRVLEVAVPAAE
jgi:hypothetical protein